MDGPVTFLTLLLTTLAMAAEPIPFDSLWDYSQPRETEVKFRALLQDQRHKQPKEWQMELRTQIARALGLQKKFKEGHALLDEFCPSAAEVLLKIEMRCALERGRLHNSANDKPKARLQFQLAYDLATEQKWDFFAVDAAHMLALAAEAPKEQVAWNEKALALAEASKEEGARKWLGALYNNLAWIRHDEGQYVNAQGLFEKSRREYEKKGDAAAERIARWSMAKMKRLRGLRNEALRDQQALESEYRRLKEKDPYVLEELGELYLAAGEKVKSKAYFRDAYELLYPQLSLEKSELPRLARMKELAGRDFNSPENRPKGPAGQGNPASSDPQK